MLCVITIAVQLKLHWNPHKPFDKPRFKIYQNWAKGFLFQFLFSLSIKIIPIVLQVCCSIMESTLNEGKTAKCKGFLFITQNVNVYLRREKRYGCHSTNWVEISDPVNIWNNGWA